MGYLDALALIPLGIAIPIKLLPPGVVCERRAKAERVMASGKPTNWAAAGMIVASWLLAAALTVVVVMRVMRWW